MNKILHNYFDSILLSIFFLTFICCACTNEDATVQALRNSGFTNITTTGYDPFQCSEDDTYSTGFTATNSQGAIVSGTVCCGIVFKGCTVRF
jgi:hypothetical protein